MVYTSRWRLPEMNLVTAAALDAAKTDVDLHRSEVKVVSAAVLNTDETAVGLH
jgi:hypothetical protein